jgi:hypothetical protein
MSSMTKFGSGPDEGGASHDGFNIALDLAGLLIAQFRFLFQGAQNHLVPSHIHPRFAGRRRVRARNFSRRVVFFFIGELGLRKTRLVRPAPKFRNQGRHNQ